LPIAFKFQRRLVLARGGFTVAQDVLKSGEGRFFRGNLHCHSNRSDGLRAPEEVAAAYRDAGYNFIVLSDHFEAEYSWQVTDTRDLRGEGFTTIIGAELSSAAWTERNVYWVSAAGLPLDFEPPAVDDHAGAITRAAECGAFVVMLHPGLNNLPLAAAGALPALNAVHAVEIYNHNMASGGLPDRAHGAYMLDGLLERGYRLLVNAGDDAHFGHPADRFGGWVEVFCEQLDPEALLASLKAGHYYSTQGARPARAARGGRPLVGGDKRCLRHHTERERRPVVERGDAYRQGRRSARGDRVRSDAVPRFVLPRHAG
jgi:hypothetical protein